MATNQSTESSDSTDSVRLNELLQQASRGDDELFSELLEKHRQRLQKIIAVRIDNRLRGRIDPSDVVQEAYLEASQRLDGYLVDRKLPFFLWLRFITLQKLALTHRQHLGTQARDASRDISLYRHPSSEPSSAVLAEQLLGRLTGPSQVALRTERMMRVQQALERLDPVDVEVLVLRHFEELTHTEIGKLLGIQRAGASHRYQRALKNIRTAIEELPGGMEGLR